MAVAIVGLLFLVAGGPLPPFDYERSKVEISLLVLRWVCTWSVVFPTPPLPCGLYLERVQEERFHSCSKHCHILFRKVASFSSPPASRERGPSHSECHSTALILLVNECAVCLSNSLHVGFLSANLLFVASPAPLLGALFFKSRTS